MLLQFGGASAIFTREMKKDPSLVRGSAAMCLSGSARSLTQKKILASLSGFLSSVNATGIESTGGPDVFAFLALDDANAYPDLPFAFLNNSKSDVEKALSDVNAVSFELTQDPMELTNDTLDRAVPNNEICYMTEGGFYASRSWRLPNSISQVIHMQKCVKLIQAREKKIGKKYELAILARPDLEYKSVVPDNLLQEAYDGEAVADSDHWMAMPRAMADGLITNYNAFANCAPGDSCCGKITKSEELFEYLLGFEIALSGSCECLGSREPDRVYTHRKREWDISRE